MIFLQLTGIPASIENFRRLWSKKRTRNLHRSYKLTNWENFYEYFDGRSMNQWWCLTENSCHVWQHNLLVQLCQVYLFVLLRHPKQPMKDENRVINHFTLTSSPFSILIQLEWMQLITLKVWNYFTTRHPLTMTSSIAIFSGFFCFI